MDKRWSALYLQVVQTVQNASPAVLTTLFLYTEDGQCLFCL